jgi:glutaredoxin 3
MAAKVEIYTWKSCPFCHSAKNLLEQKGIDFLEYSIDGDEPARDKMSERSYGKRSVPQIFINDVHIGGCNDIYALETAGKLDELLAVSN